MTEKQIIARMAELADALDSGSSEGNLVQVQILFRALSIGLVGVLRQLVRRRRTADAPVAQSPPSGTLPREMVQSRLGAEYALTLSWALNSRSTVTIFVAGPLRSVKSTKSGT